MANQTITTDTNHDDLVGRLAGESITINNGSVLTIDSMPQHTPMGILGDINLNSGEIHIDGRNVREISYNNGSGTLPNIGTSLTYGTSGTAKVIMINSGDSTSGVITITIQGDLEEPNGTITDGIWSATVLTSKIGLLMVFGEAQVWDAVDATCTLRITGDWYEIGVGDGTDNQEIVLPHSGCQHAVWVETGNNTGVFEIWHRVYGDTSTVFWDENTVWGDTFETGFTFRHTPGTSTLTFGTTTNGGVPPIGARIRIPNVHIGTTTVASPLTEVITTTTTGYINMIDTSVSENVLIDHLNASTVRVTFNRTNGANVKDSCFGIWNSTLVVGCNSEVFFTNCAIVSGTGLTGDLPALSAIITDNLGGIFFNDCVVMSGANTNNSAALNIITSANISFSGRNKLISNQQDENTMAAIRATTTSNIFNSGLLCLLNGGIIITTGSIDIDLGDIAWGQLLSRGNTENNLSLLNISSSYNINVNSGRFLDGSNVGPFRGRIIIMNDAANVTIQNFGDVDAKLDNGGFSDQLVNISGITNNVILRRIWFTNLAASQALTLLNTATNITVENFSSDYNDELEIDSSRTIVKGIHAGSGMIGASTGVEDDLVNVIGTVFYDHFKSDTTGAIGLLFNDRGLKHFGDVEIVSGNPIWNGLGDLLMKEAGDQIIYTFPYKILGHTGFSNLNIQKVGVNPQNFDIDYDIDTGSGYSGIWKTASAANISSETISPSGFGMKIRITCNTTAANNSLRGLSFPTETTIAAQKANLYPADAKSVTLTGLRPGSEVRAFVGTSPNNAIEIGGTENSTTSFTFSHTVSGQEGFIVVFSLGFQPIRLPITYPSTDISIPIQQNLDRVYKNP